MRMTESVKQTHVLMSKRKLRNLLIQAFGQGKGDVWESSFSVVNRVVNSGKRSALLLIFSKKIKGCGQKIKEKEFNNSFNCF